LTLGSSNPSRTPFPYQVGAHRSRFLDTTRLVRLAELAAVHIGSLPDTESSIAVSLPPAADTATTTAPSPAVAAGVATLSPPHSEEPAGPVDPARLELSALAAADADAAAASPPGVAGATGSAGTGVVGEGRVITGTKKAQAAAGAAAAASTNAGSNASEAATLRGPLGALVEIGRCGKEVTKMRCLPALLPCLCRAVHAIWCDQFCEQASSSSSFPRICGQEGWNTGQNLANPHPNSFLTFLLFVPFPRQDVWRAISRAVLQRARHRSPSVRREALHAATTLYRRLGADFLAALPEQLPALAELLADPVAEVWCFSFSFMHLHPHPFMCACCPRRWNKLRATSARLLRKWPESPSSSTLTSRST